MTISHPSLKGSVLPLQPPSSGKVSFPCTSQKTGSVLASCVLPAQQIFCNGSESEMLQPFPISVTGDHLIFVFCGAEQGI